jgi:hypothetical protein
MIHADGRMRGRDDTKLRLVPVERRPNDRVDLLAIYIEEVWCSTIGASGVILARRFSRLLLANPNGTELDVADLAARMGVRPARVTATLDRLVRWGFVTVLADAIGVSGYAPLVPPARLARLPASVVAAHRLCAGAEG